MVNGSIIIMVGFLIVVTVTAFARDGRLPEISREEFQQARKRGDKMLILDVRTPKEFGVGRVSGAFLMPHGQVIEAPDTVSQKKDEMIVMYCEGAQADCRSRSHHQNKPLRDKPA